MQSTDGFNLLYWFNMTREHYFRVQEWAWWCNGVPGLSFCQNLLPASRRLFLTSPGSWDWVQRRKWCFWHWLFQWFLLVYSEVLVLRCRVLVEDCCKNDALQNVKSRFIDRWIFFSNALFFGSTFIRRHSHWHFRATWRSWSLRGIDALTCPSAYDVAFL